MTSTLYAGKRSRIWLVYLVSGLALAGLLAWATTEEIARNPARDATADLGTHGPVTIRFSTDPYPALPTGTVVLRFIPMDPRGRGVTIDGLSFEYGREGDEEIVGVGETQAMSDGSGMWMSAAQFPSVGNWWIRVSFGKGGQQAEVRFTFYVEPAQ